jgi:hypothetical protein
VYVWNTYPLTTFLEEIWKEGLGDLQAKKAPRTALVELCSAAERALNFMHTGNAAVIATGVMNPLWIGRAIVQDGLPCINPKIAQPIKGKIIRIMADQWPFDENKHIPKTASKRAQRITYGDGHFNVSFSSVTSRINGRETNGQRFHPARVYVCIEIADKGEIAARHHRCSGGYF